VEALMAVILEAGLAHDHVKDKSIYIRLDDISDYAIVIDYQYEIKEWQESDETIFRNPKEKVFRVTTEMNLEILHNIEMKGIKLAFPDMLKYSRLTGS
jgi:hypothetical protein